MVTLDGKRRDEAKEKQSNEVIGWKIGYRLVKQAHKESFRSGRVTME